jgi:hypothetical protein
MNKFINFFIPKFEDFHASKFLMNFILLGVGLNSIYNTFVKDDLFAKQLEKQNNLIEKQNQVIQKQFAIIQENEKKSELAKERYLMVLLDYSNQFRRLIFYFEDIKGRVTRERENYNVLVGVLVESQNKDRALLLEILEISDSKFAEIMKKHNISIDSSYKENTRAYNNFKAQKLNKKP